MAKQTKVYTGITRDNLNRIREALRQRSINLPVGDSGSISAPYGFTVSYRYSGTDLSVTLDGSIFLIGTAWKKLDDGIKSA